MLNVETDLVNKMASYTLVNVMISLRHIVEKYKQLYMYLENPNKQKIKH